MLKLIVQSIPLKICLSILLIETLFLAVIGVFYTSRFNKEIDKAVTDKLLLPAVLMSERALNYSAATDLAVMSELVQEDVVNSFISKADGTIYYTNDPNLEGKLNNTLFAEQAPSFQGEVQSTAKVSSAISSTGRHYLATLSPLMNNDAILGTLYIRINADSIVSKKKSVLRLFWFGAAMTIFCTTLFEAYWVYSIIVPRIKRTSFILRKVESYDLTVRVKDYGAEDQLGTLMQQVDTVIEKLQTQLHQLLHAEKLSAIGSLSASIAHEFNNPLYGVMTVIEGVKRTAPLDDEDAKLIDMALVECHRMKDLIRNLQDFNRPSSGSVTPLNIHSTINSLLLLSKKEFTTRGVTVVTNYAEDMPMITGVGDQIKQVVLNLLNNASYACDGGGTITITTEVIGKRNITIAIQDNGRGIETEHMDRIFDPFFTTKSKTKGTGLGLSISEGIIKEHGGTIVVESETGKGSTFTVTLPIKGEINA